MIHVPKAAEVFDESGKCLEGRERVGGLLRPRRESARVVGVAARNHRDVVDPFAASPALTTTPTQRNAPTTRVRRGDRRRPGRSTPRAMPMCKNHVTYDPSRRADDKSRPLDTREPAHAEPRDRPAVVVQPADIPDVRPASAASPRPLNHALAPRARRARSRRAPPRSTSSRPTLYHKVDLNLLRGRPRPTFRRRPPTLPPCESTDRRCRGPTPSLRLTLHLLTMSRPAREKKKAHCTGSSWMDGNCEKSTPFKSCFVRQCEGMAL